MKYSELKEACRTAKTILAGVNGSSGTLKLSNEWKLKAAVVAKRTLFYLIDPKGRQFGGDDAMNTFVPWAMKFMEVN